MKTKSGSIVYLYFKSQLAHFHFFQILKFSSVRFSLYVFFSGDSMDNKSSVFNLPDTLELETGDMSQPKHDKDSMYFKVKYWDSIYLDVFIRSKFFL